MELISDSVTRGVINPLKNPRGPSVLQIEAVILKKFVLCLWSLDISRTKQVKKRQEKSW